MPISISEELLFLNEQDVRDLLTPEDAIRAAENTFYHIGTGDIRVGQMSLMVTDDTGANNFHTMPAVLRDKQVAGMKWISTFGNPQPGYPFSHGNLVILSDTSTGSPFAIVGATAITAMRTAGGHGVVQAKYLANPNPLVLSVFGCGVQARAGIKGFLFQFPSIQQVRIFSRSRRPVDQVSEELKGRAEVICCASASEALAGSNLVLMASGAVSPLLTADLLRPGMTIIGIEGFRDMDSEISRKAKWFLGYRPPDMDIIQDSELNPDGTLSIEEVFGDMTEVLTGKIPGRENSDEIIVSTHMGMGAHDLNCAYLVYLRAKEQHRGIPLLLNQWNHG